MGLCKIPQNTCDQVSQVAFRIVPPGLKKNLRPTNGRIIVGQKVSVFFKLRLNPWVLREGIIKQNHLSSWDANTSHRGQQLSRAVKVESHVSEILGVLVDLNIKWVLRLGLVIVFAWWPVQQEQPFQWKVGSHRLGNRPPPPPPSQGQGCQWRGRSGCAHRRPSPAHPPQQQASSPPTKHPPLPLSLTSW